MFVGSTKYSEIQKFISNTSPSLLRDRLRFLESQGLVMRKRAVRGNRCEYFLTPSGKALAPLLTEMAKWGMRYARQGMTDKANTASELARDFAGRLDVDELPSGNTSVQLNLTDVEGMNISEQEFIAVVDTPRAHRLLIRLRGVDPIR